MSKIMSIIGIILVMVGTIFSLWSILCTKSDYIGTAEQYRMQSEDFKKNKKIVILGTILIFIGSGLQIAGLLLYT